MHCLRANFTLLEFAQGSGKIASAISITRKTHIKQSTMNMPYFSFDPRVRACRSLNAVAENRYSEKPSYIARGSKEVRILVGSTNCGD